MVTGVDSSATHSFTQIKRAATAHGARIILANLSNELEKAFRANRFVNENVLIFANLDEALEACEASLIASAQSARAEAKSLHDWLTEATGSTAHADCLVKQCVRIEVAAGDIIARQGDVADALHFILDGRVNILVESGDNQSRVRSLGAHTTVGEMGLISRRPRSATIRAETPSVLYALSFDDYERIKAESPAAGLALLSYIIAVMSERLSFANRVNGVLQR
jgi:SulP family sulfate permease